jgi:hypothetical protein
VLSLIPPSLVVTMVALVLAVDGAAVAAGLVRRVQRVRVAHGGGPE